jgi:Family of unknown function (DUF6352)
MKRSIVAAPYTACVNATNQTPQPTLWPACGHTLLARNAHGWLQPTPAWVQRLYARPELVLIEESCAAEVALHGQLQQDPLRPVSAAELARLRDADARENWGHVLAFRDALVAAGSLQAWLLALFNSGHIGVPPVFIDAVVQAIVASLIEPADSAVVARAAEFFFRAQRVSRVEGRLLAGDQHTLDLQNDTRGFGDLGRLLAQAKMPTKAVQLEVLSAQGGSDNQALYWADAAREAPRHAHLLDLTHEIKQELGHGLAFHMTHAHSGLKALALMIERWVGHLLALRVTVQPVQRVDDANWRWHLGLDVHASALLNDLYEGHAVDEERLARLLSLFTLNFADPREMRSDVAGKPIYLGLMSAPDGLVRMKPQNLLLNLPLARRY